MTPANSLPPYSYVPGRFPHPVIDPAGHSYGQQPQSVAPLDPARWQQSREFCHALRLFDAGYYWEAHEAWEALWIAAGRTGPVATALKGLIKLAAAGVKAREGNAAGVGRHARRAAELLRMAKTECSRQLGAEAQWAGLDLDNLAVATDGIAASPGQFVDSDAVAVKVVLPVRLTIGELN